MFTNKEFTVLFINPKTKEVHKAIVTAVDAWEARAKLQQMIESSPQLIGIFHEASA